MTKDAGSLGVLAIYYEVWMLQLKVHYQLLILSFTPSYLQALFSLRPASFTLHFSTISTTPFRPSYIFSYIKSPPPTAKLHLSSLYIFLLSQHLQDILWIISITQSSQIESYITRTLTPCLQTIPPLSQNPTHQTHVSPPLHDF